MSAWLWRPLACLSLIGLAGPCAARQDAAHKSAAAGVRLPAKLSQGQLVIGHAPAGSVVDYDSHETHVGADGLFVIGLGRDAPRTLALAVRLPDGTPVQVHRDVRQRQYAVERVNGLPQKTVTPPKAVLERIHREAHEVARMRTRDDRREDFLGGFRLPVQGARISGEYGSQRIDNGVPKSPHMGLDLAVASGTPIHAPAGGVVTLAKRLYLSGGTVLIDHGHGLDSSFLHLSRIDVRNGQHVRRGQVIGAAGATGRATGPHLHWGFNWFEVRLDPALLPRPRN